MLKFILGHDKEGYKTLINLDLTKLVCVEIEKRLQREGFNIVFSIYDDDKELIQTYLHEETLADANKFIEYLYKELNA